jgi:hypothetical protein
MIHATRGHAPGETVEGPTRCAPVRPRAALLAREHASGRGSLTRVQLTPIKRDRQLQRERIRSTPLYSWRPR